MIAIVTTMLFVLRFVELIIDPMIGGVVDNTRSTGSKFKPWILFGGTIGSVCIVLLFTDLGGLSTSNPFLYIILFIVIFAVNFDIVYSFKDIAFGDDTSTLQLIVHSANQLVFLRGLHQHWDSQLWLFQLYQ